MHIMKLKVLDFRGHTRMTGTAQEGVSLVYTNAYEQGDRIVIETDVPGQFCVIQLEDTLAPALVYLGGNVLSYSIPAEENRVVFSPKSFVGNRHLIRARFARPEEIAARRCLTNNPYDQHGSDSFYPHASANVETRDEAVFAAYNAIDGIFENNSHGEWPYQSWGINRDPKAALKIEFGRKVFVDEVRLTLRADFPHDNYWVRATVEFSDGTEETVSLTDSSLPQAFAIPPHETEWLVLKNLIKAEGASPFPALTQLEAYGTELQPVKSQNNV
ncbi:MAG: carbohydrate-binding protein [Ruthenibacterium sp.]